MDTFDVTLRRLAIRDRAFSESVRGSDELNVAASGLTPKIHALVQLGALIALDASVESYSPCVDAARSHGATDEEIVGALVAIVPLVGEPRVVSAAPKLGLALGYDLDAALEDSDPAGVHTPI